MKKIYIILKDITESGGGERVCVNLANAFNEVGYKVSIISFFRFQSEVVFSLHENINIYFLSHTTPKSKNLLKKLFIKSVYRNILGYKADKIIANDSPDVVLANDGWYIPKIKLDSIKYVRLWHLKAPKKIDKRKQRIFNLFDTLVVLSSKEFPIWQKYHQDVRVIPNFLPVITEKITDFNQCRVIAVGRMSAEKGFFRLIDIWEKVQEQFKQTLQEEDRNKQNLWQLIIVGDGALKEQIESKIKTKNLQDSIILRPFTKDIESQYLDASIYAMTSHFEGFPMVLLESCSYGLCPIAFDIATGPSDIIEHNNSGYLINDNDVQEYVAKLIKLMNDKKTRESMGKNAKQRVSKTFSKEAVIKGWQQIFE